MSGRGFWAWCVLVLSSCGSDVPGAPIPREGRLEGEPPSVLILLVEAAEPADLDRQGALVDGPLAARGTRMEWAFARFDGADAARQDLLGGPAGLPGVTGGGDLQARFVAAGYRTPEVSGTDLSPLWTGEGPAFALLELGQDGGLEQAAGIVAAIDGSGHGSEVLWAVTALQGDPSAAPISEGRLHVPMVIGLTGRMDAAELRPQVVSHADLGSTLLDLCGLGLSPGPGAEGVSFARILLKQPHAWRGHVVARRVEPVEGEARAWVRSLKWRLVAGGPGGERLTWVSSDPAATGNDRGRPGAKLALEEMRRVLGEWAGE